MNTKSIFLYIYYNDTSCYCATENFTFINIKNFGFIFSPRRKAGESLYTAWRRKGIEMS